MTHGFTVASDRVWRLRPITPGWQCQRTGDCCTQVPALRMTVAERAAIDASGISPQRPAAWDLTSETGWAFLQAQPCPYFTRDENRQGVCTIYAVRPFVCRRFGCFRPVPDKEPLELDRSPLGCRNLSDRVGQSAEVLHAYRRMQRKAQEWAVLHGWKKFRRVDR